MSAIQVIAIRSWMISLMILAIFGIRGELAELATRNALKFLPLADTTVVFFSSTFVLTAASALFLKESVGIHRWSAVVIGFVGVVIAMNPQGEEGLNAYLLLLVATTIYAMIFISGKRLSTTDSVISLVFSLQLGMGFMATLMLPWVWVPVTLVILAQLMLSTISSRRPLRERTYRRWRRLSILRWFGRP
jgi:drug/metabolite transporter (DMT)-like permease